eukprot:TRINITY_DN957_c0_g1_i1.p1 TRINITY_DN957_c0_g1~~TRINITY_DN957_c0_g1_i1.p1  ORF type:complete len:367 (+),score=46.76 TRINITY_DN957_c0_g1_i1:833-1933(+)
MGGSDRLTGRCITYHASQVIGSGSFGVVFQATIAGTSEVVAIKKVLQDKRFKNRELQIMRMVEHPHVVPLRHCFYSEGVKDEVYLNLVLEFVPDTVYRVLRQYSKSKKQIPMNRIKLYAYQMCRALGYIHALGICHRDLKPQNILVDPASGVIKLCDFGSAKCLVKGEPNVSYICSRYYRAPELIFGATDYTSSIDTWSLGCVLAELLLGQPIFPGESNVDQLVEIIKVLGTPTREDVKSMNRNYTEFTFPDVKPHPWNKLFKNKATPDAIDLVTRFLRFAPEKRLRPLEACLHPFFDELREHGDSASSGEAIPPLFNMTAAELNSCPDIASRLVPPHARGQLTPDAHRALERAISVHGDFYESQS